HNPMFEPPRRDRSLQKGTEGGGERLRPYTTSVACFSNGSFQVLLINNSVAPYSPRGETWQGLLHTATVRNPSDALRRVVNSLMVASVPAGEPEPVPEAGQEAFVRTEVVRRRGYDRTHLDDDA
ncbi:MAG TPA: hypothetical protein VIL46_07750, partial [Gemmataceae bacterium]